jgi:hypothetical protein
MSIRPAVVLQTVMARRVVVMMKTVLILWVEALDHRY